jgi:hypothetical protein
VVNLPVYHPWPIFEVWTHLLRDVHKLKLLPISRQSCSNDSFVFNGVERASAVYQASSFLEKFEGSFKDIKLKRMKSMTEMRIEVLPEHRVLA